MPRARRRRRAPRPPPLRLLTSTAGGAGSWSRGPEALHRRLRVLLSAGRCEHPEPCSEAGPRLTTAGWLSLLLLCAVHCLLEAQRCGLRNRCVPPYPGVRACDADPPPHLLAGFRHGLLGRSRRRAAPTCVCCLQSRGADDLARPAEPVLQHGCRDLLRCVPLLLLLLSLSLSLPLASGSDRTPNLIQVSATSCRSRDRVPSSPTSSARSSTWCSPCASGRKRPTRCSFRCSGPTSPSSRSSTALSRSVSFSHALVLARPRCRSPRAKADSPGRAVQGKNRMSLWHYCMVPLSACSVVPIIVACSLSRLKYMVSSTSSCLLLLLYVLS